MARDSSGPGDEGFAPPSVEDASGYGVSATLVGAVLLALGYYGVLAVRGPEGFGAVPDPFYFLAFALLFAVELARSRDRGGAAVVRALAFTAVYGTLTVLAVEGAVSLWRDPAPALDGFAGVTVLAAALVVSALAYFLYLSVVEAG